MPSVMGKSLHCNYIPVPGDSWGSQRGRPGGISQAGVLKDIETPVPWDASVMPVSWVNRHTYVGAGLLWSSLLTCHVMTVFHKVIFELLTFKNHCLLLGGESGPRQDGQAIHLLVEPGGTLGPWLRDWPVFWVEIWTPLFTGQDLLLWTPLTHLFLGLPPTLPLLWMQTK